MSTPTSSSHRIVAIDVLRGFALLGILVMNIQFFAMPAAAYFNPTAYGDLTGANRWVWILSHLLTDHKILSAMALYRILPTAGPLPTAVSASAISTTTGGAYLSAWAM